jgi:acyl-CoA thioesterase-2
LFGGTVAAQSIMAAGLTVEPERELHSLHAYFLRPGSHDAPIRFVVDRIRDGRTFTTRRVKAHQGGEAIFNLAASFKVPETGIEHQSTMPEAPDPETVENWEEMRARLMGDESELRRESALEVRMVDALSREPSQGGPAKQRVWMRLRGEVPDNALIRTALLTYASDRTLLSTAVRPHGLHWGRGMAASLDHAMWFHRPFKLDDWLLYASESPVAFAARGLCLGSFFTREGACIASVAQEALIRINT